MLQGVELFLKATSKRTRAEVMREIEAAKKNMPRQMD